MYHALDFEKDEFYTSKLEEKEKDPRSVAVENELFEVLLFNNRDAFPFNNEELETERMLRSNFPE